MIGQIENKENFIQVMIKYYTQIIRGEIKKGLNKDFLFVYYVYAMCMPKNYNRLAKLFSINMQILDKKSSLV